VLAAAAILGVGRWLWVTGPGAIRDAYAGLQLSAMLVEYMKANDDQWPRDWEDLRPYYAVALENGGSDYCTFDQIRACMWVDFSVDPSRIRDALNDSEEPSDRFISPRNGPTDWGGWQPNRAILRHITS